MGASRRFSAFALCLALALGLSGILSPASAQQQEKRIALVVGNGAYGKSPLATAANDAGLVAQTLQAAGFDVVGARDLDGDTLRRTLRDFIQKAETSGPDTVAMVYLAGYGMQLAGENYFVPVDSGISRETDIPTEGLRIGDYVRRLGTLPLKASIVVLDVARQQPFVEGGQPIASGLALVEPEPHMLIAFNAAPGTVAPVEQGPYGTYAQSLAEMIRTGGLPLPELFDRLRLRVNDASKGAQVPWHAQKIDTNFVFFDRAPDAPTPATSDQVAAVRSKPIRDLGPRDAYAAALERDTLQGYDDFVATYPGDPLAKRVRALAAARREAITWLRTYRTDTPEAYWSYLRRYPNGPHAADARRRLAILTAPVEPPPVFTAIEYDVPPPPPEEIVYIGRPVLVFSDPYYGFVPPPPPPVYFLPPPPPDFVILAPPPPPIGLFILPQPVFVAMPVYVRAPVYVAPPPNNIIFANIHNTTVINTVINRPPAPPPGGALPPDSVRGPLGAKGGMPLVAPGPGAATPALPPSVAQKATFIQQGKAPVPPSAAINPALASPGTPAGPGGVAPNALPANAPALAPQGQQLPRANALPVPGTKGAPPLPPAGTAVAPATDPNAKTGTLSPPPLGAAPKAAPGTPATAGLPKAGLPKGASTNAPAAVVGTPKVDGPSPGAGTLPKPGSAALTPSSPAPSPGAAGAPPPKPGATSVAKPPPGVPPSARTAPPLPSQASRPAASPPPPRLNAPPPPARVATPSPPPARISAPPPPAPRVSAPPPPPPRMAAPPPAARVAAPPPPPPPRMAAPPPPRPVAPPPAAAKRCPPNVPRC
ncbi:MAG: caspase family protein [Bradyrhizobium sp.]